MSITNSMHMDEVDFTDKNFDQLCFKYVDENRDAFNRFCLDEYVKWIREEGGRYGEQEDEHCIR